MVNFFVYNKLWYYESLLRNDYMLPDYKSPFVTLEYLLGVLEGRFWTP